MRALLFLPALLAAAASFAEEGSPSVHVADDGTVVGRMVLDAPETLVRQTITELTRAPYGSDVLEMNLVPEGACLAVFRKTRGLFTPLELRTRLCPTDSGWRERLVESSDFNAYETEWSVRPGEGGVAVQLSVRSGVNLSVPTALVRQSTIRGVRESFATMLARLLQKKQTP